MRISTLIIINIIIYINYASGHINYNTFFLSVLLTGVGYSIYSILNNILAELINKNEQETMTENEKTIWTKLLNKLKED